MKNRSGTGHPAANAPKYAGESSGAQETLKQQKHPKMHLNEAGRTTESDERGNPKGSVESLPQPSLRGTGKT